MEIGTKIKQLREKKRLSQSELASKLGIGQTTLGFIESGETKKVDFLLMDKICKEFDVDFEYFTQNSQINNLTELNGNINNQDPINLIKENILEQIKSLINDNKQKDILIDQLKSEILLLKKNNKENNSNKREI